MGPATAKKLFDLVESGGRVFCIESYPEKSCGWNNHQQRDEELQEWINKSKAYPDRFILLKKPKKNFVTERSRKVIPKKQVVGRLSDSTNHLYINLSLKKSFYEEPNYLSMVA
jgi:hypothetical protein